MRGTTSNGATPIKPFKTLRLPLNSNEDMDPSQSLSPCTPEFLQVWERLQFPQSLKQPTRPMESTTKKLTLSKSCSPSSSLPASASSSSPWGTSLHLLRSKSCGDGRASAPSDEFDIMSCRASQPQGGVLVLYDSNKEEDGSPRDSEDADGSKDDDFKCSALCLFLPGISKKKTTAPAAVEARKSSLSRLASLEKFECASWNSAGVAELEDSSNVETGSFSYFDLPLELIRCSTDDTCSAVKAAFVFEKDLKGVLKKDCSRSGARKSCESTTRHVRFSTSAPTSYPASPTSPCITPRLLRATEEFNALLEATGG
ncbi:hypothetical protein HPP92_015983 [Vanilla planifolia]|uniref:Uncharacterized protein n=1 Tax=Vanilla planifolia TaxID=51239 RepID=A0A835QIW6_VANPL|nr:hypothetical protein HPP92_015983 [Vanilla planifolia]